MDGFSLTDVFTLFACLLSTISFLFSVYNFIENRANAKATHTVQYVDVPYPGTTVDNQGFETIPDEVKEKFMDDDFEGYN